MYNKLKSRNINCDNQKVNQKLIIKILLHCYQNSAFSTFPYILENSNSDEAINKYNCGNCIAMSKFLKKYLQEKYNITSYLIPASIPRKYSKNGYLKISHVALAIPRNNQKIYIADPAFYFLNPIKLRKYNTNDQLVYSKNIYRKELETDVMKYKSIEKLLSKTKKLEDDLVLNEYQTIPKDTFFSNVRCMNDPTDSWDYYLTEIINPDEAISNFFINIFNRPFILTTKLDSNNICVKDVYINFISHNLLEITHDETVKNYNMDNLNVDELKKDLQMIGNKIERFFNNDLIDILLEYYKNNNKIYKVTNC